MNYHPISIKEDFTTGEKIGVGAGAGAAAVIAGIGVYSYIRYNSTTNKILRSIGSTDPQVAKNLTESLDKLGPTLQREIKYFVDFFGADKFLESFGADSQRGSGDLQSSLVNYDFDTTFQNFSTKLTTNVSRLTSFGKNTDESVRAKIASLDDQDIKNLNEFYDNYKVRDFFYGTVIKSITSNDEGTQDDLNRERDFALNDTLDKLSSQEWKQFFILINGNQRGNVFNSVFDAENYSNLGQNALSYFIKLLKSTINTASIV